MSHGSDKAKRIEYLGRYHMVPRATGLDWVPVQQRAEDLTTAERRYVFNVEVIYFVITTILYTNIYIREYNIIIVILYCIGSWHISRYDWCVSVGYLRV